MGIPTTLRCLGHPTLLDANGGTVRLRSQKHLALLIYLMLEGRSPIRRERLADLFWPDAGTQEARHSLGTAIWGLRNRVAPDGFPGDQRTIRTTVELECDLDRLERGDVLATDLLPALEVDAFLEDFELPDAPGFSHWRDSQRARLWPAIEAALVRQMDHCRRTGDFTGIVSFAERVLRHNPLSEEGVRALIEARAFAGDRIGALRAFETWRRDLADELHAQPSERLEAMARRLRRGTLEGGGDGTRPRVPTEQWKDRTFIGRTAEYRTLYEAWERTTRGEPTHALVIGESGIGKSTLIQRMMTAASLDGAVTSRVQCYELEREIPYAALGALVRGLLERPEALGTSPQSLADLAQAVPAVRDHFPHLPEALQLQGESFRIRVTDAMEALLRTIAEETPVILVVDDFHMADDASVSVVHLLVRRFEQERVMVALAARPAGPNESPNIARVRESHARLGFVSLEVPPMADDEAAEMLDVLSGDGPAPGKSVREAMLRAARGYPMALELFVGEWLSSGESSLALAVPAMREDLGHRPPPEDAYRMALDRIYEGLDPSTRLVLQLAAVLGPRLNELVLYRIVDLGIGATGEAMGRLRAARLLRETEDRLEFVNELVRGHAYLSIPKPVRTALHGEVVGHLLSGESTGQTAPGLEVAWHLIRAGRRDEASPYLLRGARESMRGGAPFEAERGLTSALAWLNEPHRSEALLLVGEALQEQGRMLESVAFLDAVVDSARPSVISRRNVLRLHARRCSGEQDRNDTQALIHLLLDEADRAAEINTRLRALWMAAGACREHLESDLLAQVWSSLQRVLDMELCIEDQGERALGVAMYHYAVGDKAKSLETIDRILGTLETQGVMNSVYLSLLVGLGAVQTGLGAYQQAEQSAEKGLRIARKIGDERKFRTIAGNLALIHGRLGNPEIQLKWAEKASSISLPETNAWEHQQIHFSKARAHAIMGNEEAALSALSDGALPSTQPQPESLIQGWCLRSADVLALLGRLPRAISAARPGVIGRNSGLKSDAFAGPYARWSAILSSENELPILEAKMRLTKLLEREHRLDQIDRAEVVFSSIWLECKTGEVDPDERANAWKLLEGLPDGAVAELRQLGMLAFT